MNDDPPEELNALYAMAAAQIAAGLRPAVATALCLDMRLAAIGQRVSEPILAQMRFAWWRERLSEPVEARPRGDAVLDAIGLHWSGRETTLIDLVDGWEAINSEVPPEAGEIASFAQGRGSLFAAIATQGAASLDLGRKLGETFSYGELVAGYPDDDVKDVVLALASDRERIAALPGALRGLSVLGGLGARVLRRGKGPLFGDRGSALTALRLGIFGR